MKILWDSGNVGFGGCGINEWDRNVIGELRNLGHEVVLLVDNLLARRPKFKKWNPPNGGYSRVDTKITPENYLDVVSSFGPFDVQVGNHFTMYPILGKVVPICHDYDIPGRKDYSRGIKLSLQGICTLTDRVACTTPFIEKQVRDSISGVETCLLYGGSKLRPMPKEKIEKPYIAYWGNRYSKEKNFISLLKTLPHHNLDMVVCSFLPPSPAELETVAKLGVEKRVCFHTGVSDEELNTIVSNSALYVCPSTYEGFGLPAVEAMAAGVPVIVSPCASLPSVVEGVGYVAKSHRVKDLAAAIKEVLGNPEETELRRVEALKKVENWTWSNTASILINFCTF